MKKKPIVHLLMILLGNGLYALAVCMFLVPNQLITGGSTGIALFVNRLTGCPVSVFAGVFNAAMFWLGWKVLGRKFALTTLISTVVYPACLAVLERIPHIAVVTDTPMLAVIFGGLMIGAGIGMVIRAGASTGGMDIPPLILNRKWNINVSVAMYGFDFVILLTQMASADMQRILYGILLVLVYTIVLDKALAFGANRMQVQIISAKYAQINRALLLTHDFGSTLYHVTTGYLGNEQKAIMTVVNSRDLPRLNSCVLEIDPEAFIIVSGASEVKGRGYTLEKVHRSISD